MFIAAFCHNNQKNGNKSDVLHVNHETSIEYSENNKKPKLLIHIQQSEWTPDNYTEWKIKKKSPKEYCDSIQINSGTFLKWQITKMENKFTFDWIVFENPEF